MAGREIMSVPDPATTRPLFILGCVRSGTTMVRDLLRRQPGTICPEETHYFRQGEPFHTPASDRQLKNTPTLRKHREIDGLSAGDFDRLHAKSLSRAELMCQHVHFMAQARGLRQFRWFDKTPQNVYGLPLIAAEFPQARFLHLVRNPLNVVASLKLGKVMKVDDIHGACNYWIEAVTIIRQMAPVLGERLLEMRYEDLTRDPVRYMRDLLSFSGLGEQLDVYGPDDAHRERNQYLQILDEEEQDIVRTRCRRLAEAYGYSL